MSTPPRRIRSACCARRRERPRSCAAEECDEIAPFHSIISSAVYKPPTIAGRKAEML
jgi:hypothetical protein